MKAIFNEHRNFIWTAAGQKEPDANTIATMMEPIVKLNQEIIDFKDSKRNTQFFNHLSSMADGVPAVAWVSVVNSQHLYGKSNLEAYARALHKRDA